MSAIAAAVAKPTRSWSNLVHKYLTGGAIERHRHVMEGVTPKDLAIVLKSYSEISDVDLLHSIGISVRTLQRKQEDRLNPQHSNAAIALIEVTDMATKALGSREFAEKWLAQKAIALDRERPIDLLGSAPGIEAVKDLLTRIEYGIYA
jgi:putative toxin-antitoxin system antitoxin component (TIGR02293 family)